MEYELELICIVLHTKYKGCRVQARQWLQAANNNLGGNTPLSCIYHGAVHPVLALLTTTIRG